MLFDKIVRPALYRIGRNDPEMVHERTLAPLSRLGSHPALLARLRAYYAAEAPRTVFGVRFPNPVGLAAGMDKDGRAVPAWPALGFGFVEVGTVTRLPQPGNPRPRLFQLPHSHALINRMGFNNAGAEVLGARLAGLPALGIPLGISIGKSKAAALDDAVADYQFSLRTLYPYADYFAINVSSPNTPQLRKLQDRGALTELLGELQALSAILSADLGRERATPLLVKVAPDLTDDALTELLEVCTGHGVAGIIATNTTLSRDGLNAKDAAVGRETGGLSGEPLAARSREVIRFVHQHTEGRLPIIGVGGIASPDDALRMLDAGASLLQLYTAFIYSGPALIRRIGRALAA
ncbi:MAG: quinone-dependent dihydroorotate dehydrogenase [Actinophytocola sp.]|nr:quinone-dependent dihydroorotate dehydrogenase [Actinophytocola sp.]